MAKRMKETPMFRQGDVLLFRTDKQIPADAKAKARDKGRVVLAYGEVTGHAHAISEPDAELFVVNELRLLSLKEGASLRHEEHARIELPPGTYRVVIQREYTPDEVRNVAD